MKKRIVFILAIIALAGFLSAQIPTIIPMGPVSQTLVLIKGARIRAGQYLNFGPVYGTSGYGIYDNAGTLQYKNSGGAWANLGAGGATTFLALTDTPAAYTAAGGYLVRVNTGANALEFVGLSPTINATGFSLAGGTTSKSLTVELDSIINQDLTTDTGVTFANVTDSALTATYLPKAGVAGLLGNSVVTQTAAGDVTVNETLGAELLNDGNFATEPTAAGWTLGANWTWSAVNFNVTKASGATNLSYAINLTSGALYKLVFTTSTMSGGTIIPSLGGAAAGEGYAVSTAGTYTTYIIAAGNNLLFTAATATVVTMDDISLMLVSGGDLTCARNLLLGMSGQARFGNSTYYHIIQNSAKEGLAGADLRIGLDETNRTLIICDRGDIDIDGGFAALSNPTIILVHPSGPGSGWAKIDYTGISTYGASYTISTYGNAINFQFRTDMASSNPFVFSTPANIELTDTDGRQAWLYVEPKINQSSTAAYDAIYVNSTNTALGTGATGDGNNLLNLSVSSVPKFLVNVDGSVTAGQTSVSLADNAVHDTGITAFFGTLTVKDTTTGVTGIFRLDGGTTPVIISAHTNFSTTQGTDNKINVYFSTTYKIENCNTVASVVKCALVGTI